MTRSTLLGVASATCLLSCLAAAALAGTGAFISLDDARALAAARNTLILVDTTHPN